MSNRGKDRRSNERRNEKLPVNEEKRKVPERRKGLDRREVEDRQQN